MCGICGVMTPPDSVWDREQVLRRMRDAMGHRGPDDDGVFLSDGVRLGFKRLAIIDVAGGRQPMVNDDGSIWIVYNGELYNFKALREVLAGKGWVFRTRSDTEVILRAYEALGEECVDHLRGMFAFAIWDQRKRQLLVVRDRLGIKPLYYYWDTREPAVFASEITAILTWPGVPRVVDPVALRQYLRMRYVPGPRTMLKGIFKLQPGHMLRVRGGEVSVRPYWDLPL